MTSNAQPSHQRGLRRRELLGGIGGAAALATFGAPAAVGGTAKPDAWQRVSLPAGVGSPSHLADVAANGGSVWAGGSHGVGGVERPLVLAHLDGQWRTDDLVVGWTGQVTSVAATSSSEAWAVIDSEDAGQMLLQRYHSNEWYPNWSPSERPKRVFASGGEVWVVARSEAGSSELFRLTPQEWVRLPRPPGTVYALAASAADQVWVAGEMTADGSEATVAMLARFDGTAWHTVPVGGTPRSAFGSVHLGASGEVWAGGTVGFIGRPPPLPLRPLLGRFDGTTWQEVETPVDFGPVATITGAPGGPLTWVGFSRATNRHTDPDGGTTYGDGPTFARWDGTALVPHDEPKSPGEQNATDFDLAVDGSTTWAVGRGLDADGVETARLLRTP